jgi:hypothetical protein
MQSLFQSDLLLQVTGITPARATTLLYGVIGLVSILFGWLARFRSAGPSTRVRTRSIIALVTGLIGIALSVQHLATAKGDFGSGSGRLGAIVSLVFGLTGAILGGLALARLRRDARTSHIMPPTRPGEKT